MRARNSWPACRVHIGRIVVLFPAEKIYCFSKCKAFRPSMRPGHPQIQWVQGDSILWGGVKPWGLKLNTHLHLVPRIKMWAVTPPHTHMPSLHKAKFISTLEPTWQITCAKNWVFSLQWYLHYSVIEQHGVLCHKEWRITRTHARAHTHTHTR
jgi:hypothetical protein